MSLINIKGNKINIYENTTGSYMYMAYITNAMLYV